MNNDWNNHFVNIGEKNGLVGVLIRNKKISLFSLTSFMATKSRCGTQAVAYCSISFE